MSDPQFEKVLAEHNAAYADSESFNNWMPPDGEYIASISRMKSGVAVDDEENSTPWWRLTGKIQEPHNPDLDGKEFRIGYFSSKAFGILKAAASVLAGEDIQDNLARANEVMEKAEGMLVKVAISTTYSKKHKRKFPNCDIVQVINLEQAETPAEAPAEG